MTIEIKERQFDYGPQRASWLIYLPVSEVLKAAHVQLAYHEDRLGVWKYRLAKARKKEQASMKAVNTAVTGGVTTMFQADVLATQQKQLAEGKVTAHQRFFDEFREWVAVLEWHDRHYKGIDNPTLGLTFADVEYFKISGHTPKEK